ncbi:hypothetical protein FPCIR_11841 [Fusarium pseudocircinatum]|uniref:Protein kinase domain-containing protein n=1 Tax=Fusarium pseudocircinatum TaxID=56676 RepID=A0A8H5KP83_9HYPO|nr:hypothetical protein FPCIR_11841 [Fusarium pseudocircinatum]
MHNSCHESDNDSFRPRAYSKDSEIPFAPDGNSPLIDTNVEKVKGTLGRFKGLKCVRKTIIDHQAGDGPSQAAKKRKLAQEAKILHFAKHHHVVELVHTYFVEEKANRIMFSVVMERADANLDDFLRPGSQPRLQWFGCLINVICHIHGSGIRHRDIKPSNILLKGDKVLLADFGLSLMGLGKTIPTTYQNRRPARTKEYCAPEVENGSTRGRSADVFSLGAVFLEMLLSQAQPASMKKLQLILKSSSEEGSSYAKHIDQVHKWMMESLHLTGWQNDIVSLCQRMLDPDRAKRPKAGHVSSELSKLLVSDEPVHCTCTADLVLTEDDKLVKACKARSEDEVKHALKLGADPNTLNAIHYAAENGSVNIVGLLLECGVDVDAPNPTDQTALQCAARNGCEDVVKFLLEKGADVNARDENDHTALHGAAGQDNSDIVKMLLDAGADLDAEDLDGNVAIDFAERRKLEKIIDILENHQTDDA